MSTASAEVLIQAVRARRRALGKRTLFFVGLLVIPALLNIISPSGETEYWPFIVGWAACYGLVGLSINVLTGYAGQISLAQAALMGTGAFALGNLFAIYKIPFVFAIPLSGLITALVALAVGFPALRIRGLNLAIVTITFQFLMARVVFRQQFLTGGSAGIDVPRPTILGIRIGFAWQLLYVILICGAVLWWMDRNMVKSKAGRAFFAIREDERVAASFGIPVDRYKLLAFAVSGFYAGVAGALFAVLQGHVTNELFDYQPSLEFLVFGVIGGLGSRVGVVVGSMFPVIYRQVLSGLQFYGVILGGVLLVLTLTRTPGGLAQQGRELVHLIRKLLGRSHEADPRAAIQVADVLYEQSHGTTVESLRRSVPRARMPAALLDVSDVSIRFGGVQALDGVSLQVREGEIVGLMGPNGAGKTTLFNCITGYAAPNAGGVKVRGLDVGDMPPHERAALGFGRTFQNIGLVKSQTVADNLLIAQHMVAPYGPIEGMFNTTATQRAEALLRARAREVLERLGLADVAHRTVRDLPHGVLKRVEMGAALVTGPELLLLDEPSSGMGPQEAAELATTLVDVQAAFDVTILMIEHHVPLVLEVADYVYVLNFGQMLAEGDAVSVSRNSAVVEAYLGSGVAAG